MQFVIFAGVYQRIGTEVCSMSSGGTLSNGELHVTLGASAQVSQIYFPYVGSESHTNGTVHKIGVFVDGKITWLDDLGWHYKSRLPHGALITNTVAVHEELGILLEFDDAVSSEVNVFIRSLHVVNLRNEPRHLKIFFHQAFRISDERSVSDTAYYVPEQQAVLHYRGRRAFVAGAMRYNGDAFDQFSVGRFGAPGLDGTWRDAEDGELMGCQHDSGATDSILRLSLDIPAYASQRVQYWLAVATSPRMALSLHEKLLSGESMNHLKKTATVWHRWLNPSFKIGQKLLPTQRQSFVSCLVAVRSYVDNHGAIITETDSKGEGWSRIHEAAYLLWPLIRLGYRDEALQFFTFCQQALSSEGYLSPLYRADGAWGALHGEWRDTPPIDPIDTAMVLFTFAQYQSLHPRSAVLHDFYTSLIVPMADFLSQYEYSRDSYTVSLAIATLQAASDLADKSKDQEHSVKWRTVAEDMRWASSELYEDNRQMFITNETNDLAIDGFFGAFMFGLVGLEDERLRKAAEKINQTLKTADGLYRRRESDMAASVIASLWMTQYYLEIGQIDVAQEIISKITKQTSRTGLIERSDATSLPIRTSAEYISTLLDTITKS